MGGAGLGAPPGLTVGERGWEGRVPRAACLWRESCGAGARWVPGPVPARAQVSPVFPLLWVLGGASGWSGNPGGLAGFV